MTIENITPLCPNTSKGHKVILKDHEGVFAHDVKCTKTTGHQETATEGHVMPTCINCGYVYPIAPKNAHNYSKWQRSQRSTK